MIAKEEASQRSDDCQEVVDAKEIAKKFMKVDVLSKKREEEKKKRKDFELSALIEVCC